MNTGQKIFARVAVILAATAAVGAFSGSELRLDSAAFEPCVHVDVLLADVRKSKLPPPRGQEMAEATSSTEFIAA
jgi:hypothetical protein